MKQRPEFITGINTNNFTIVNNEILKRKDLSWKAKGILVYILSLTDKDNINLTEIIHHATEGECAFRSGWKELEQSGFVQKVARRKESKIDWYVSPFKTW